MEIKYTVLLVFCLIAAVMDLYTCKVKNPLIVAGIVTGYLFCAHTLGMRGLLVSTAGLLIPLLSLMAFYRHGFFGAGDLKLFAMIGSFIGPEDIVFVMTASLFAGAVIGSVKLLLSEKEDSLHRIRFALPTFLGVAAVVFGVI